MSQTFGSIGTIQGYFNKPQPNASAVGVTRSAFLRTKPWVPYETWLAQYASLVTGSDPRIVPLKAEKLESTKSVLASAFCITLLAYMSILPR